jgi:hypothetical protein
VGCIDKKKLKQQIGQPQQAPGALGSTRTASCVAVGMGRSLRKVLAVRTTRAIVQRVCGDMANNNPANLSKHQVGLCSALTAAWVAVGMGRSLREVLAMRMIRAMVQQCSGVLCSVYLVTWETTTWQTAASTRWGWVAA